MASSDDVRARRVHRDPPLRVDHARGPSAAQTTRTIHWLATSNYESSFAADSRISERVVFPTGPTESHGMEDARFVRFTYDDGRVTYFATYTAFDGYEILPQLIETADFLSLYRIEAPMDKATELARILHQATRAVAGAIPRLRSFKDIRHYTVEINRLENDGDRVLREALASLFERGIDPMLVIRWKDIFERLEDGIDAAETVANILEGIVIKNQ